MFALNNRPFNRPLRPAVCLKEMKSAQCVMTHVPFVIKCSIVSQPQVITVFSANWLKLAGVDVDH